MKRKLNVLNLLWAVPVLMLLFSCTPKRAKKSEPNFISVLAIGNSFSEDAVEQYLWDIAQKDGKQMVIGNLYIGGCSLERHWNNVKDDVPAYRYRLIGLDGNRVQTDSVSILTALESRQWDYVTVQQVSGLSGEYDTFDPYLTDLLSFIRKHSSKETQILWHQTWAYPNGSQHQDFPRYGSDRATMYGAIVSSVKKALESHDLDGVIPSGTAIENARTTLLGEDLTRDGYHMDTHAGRYIVSLTWYERLFGVSAVGNAFTPQIVSNDRRQACQWAAHEANLKPFEITYLEGMQQTTQTPQDEAKVPSYTLPDALTFQDGTPVKTPEQWRQRRAEILSLFETEVYGKTPEGGEGVHFRLLNQEIGALGGIAIRKEVAIYMDEAESYYIPLLIYLPRDAQDKVPMFLGMNFMGNHGISLDEGITLPDADRIEAYGAPYELHERGENMRRWPLEMILGHGYGLATICRDDVDPDWHDGFQNGIHPYFYKEGQTHPEEDEWGTIGAWAWSMSRALDYFATDDRIDETRVAAIGHSRLGKTSLWAGAQDERFALVISNCSGCGGAALSRRVFGENIRAITNSFPHWFSKNFLKYAGHEDQLPVDQHELLSLIAPRPLYVASASEDLWADPRGEYLSALEVSKVYRLLGKTGLVEGQDPEIEVPQMDGDVAYHVRQGEHDILAYDWAQYIQFADRYLKDGKQHKEKPEAEIKINK